jgi:hypothetical protein
LLYAEAGRTIQGDPYDVGNWPRNLVKAAFNAMVNAETRTAAIRAIAEKIGEKGSYTTAERLVLAIEDRHRPIAPKFGSGAGLWLMRRDSDMTEHILLRLTRKGFPTMPIHDSFLVVDRSREKGELIEAMASALRDCVGNCGTRSIGYRKGRRERNASPFAFGNRNGTRGGHLSWRESARPDDPAARIVVFFPEQRQRDLFGEHAFTLPYRKIFDWRGGIVRLSLGTCEKLFAMKCGGRASLRSTLLRCLASAARIW